MKSEPMPMARLTCGHYRRIAVHEARAHVVVLCTVCHQRERPHTVLLREWYVWCESCDWDRWAGQLERDAARVKELHRRGDRFGHKVRYRYATVPGLEYTSIITGTVNDTDSHPIKEGSDHDDSHLF